MNEVIIASATWKFLRICCISVAIFQASTLDINVTVISDITEEKLIFC